MPGERTAVSVILPAYNEAPNLPELVEGCDRALRGLGRTGEILLIDDGSTDDTAGMAAGLAERLPALRTIRHPKNLGLTAALMTGFRAARGDIIVFLCADLQSDPVEDIPKLVGAIDEGADVALGVRTNRTERVFVSKLYHALSRVLFGVRFRDMNWIKAFRREVTEQLPMRSDWHRYIAILAHAAGHRIVEVETPCRPRKHGVSRFGRRRIFAGFFDLLAVKFHTSFLERPMFLFGSLGIGLLGAAGAVGTYGTIRYTLSRLTDGDYKPQPLLYAVFFLALATGLVLFSFGFLGEHLVTLREEIADVKRRLRNRPDGDGEA